MTKPYIVSVKRGCPDTLSEIFNKAGFTIDLPAERGNTRRAMVDLDQEQADELCSHPNLRVEAPIAFDPSQSFKP